MTVSLRARLGEWARPMAPARPGAWMDPGVRRRWLGLLFPAFLLWFTEGLPDPLDMSFFMYAMVFLLGFVIASDETFAEMAERRAIDFATYLTIERDTDQRHEWFDGNVYAMAGGTLEHGMLIAATTGELLRIAAACGCRVLSSDVKVRIQKETNDAYSEVFEERIGGAIRPILEYRYTRLPEAQPSKK